VLDEGSMAALIMLDLSAAFDVNDHSVLLKCLDFSFPIKEKAITWIKSQKNSGCFSGGQNITRCMSLLIICLFGHMGRA